jgi:RNA-binding protein
MRILQVVVMPALSNQERKRLRRIGHALNPVVMLGNNGLSEGVLEECSRALGDHELIKIKVFGEDRQERAALIQGLCDATGAQLVQQVGKMALIFKKASKPNQDLSNLVRYSHLAD